MVTWEYVISTAAAAFFASLAAVAVTWRLDAASKRREARSEILRSIARHSERLWKYSTVHSEVRTAGVGNSMTSKGQHAPYKPPMYPLLTEIMGTEVYFSKKAREAVREVHALLIAAEETETPRENLADWESESQRVFGVAGRVSRWDGLSRRLPS